MLKGSLSGLDRKRLRLWLLLFFLALAIPTGMLLRQTYSQLKWEALHQHRGLAEELLRRIDSNLNRLIRREESRGFSDYSFLLVAGDPAAGLLQRSTLSVYPPVADIPGLIGYFQVDSGGLFSSPLLPESGGTAVRYGIPAEELQQRQALVAQVQSILTRNRLVSEDKIAGRSGVADSASAPGRRDREADDTGQFADRAIPLPQATTAYESPAETVSGQAVFDQLNEAMTPGKKGSKQDRKSRLGRVDDLKLEQRFEETDAQEPGQPASAVRAPTRTKRIMRKEFSALPEAEDAMSTVPPVRIHTFESEIDPLEFSLLDSGQFVLFRKVWRDGKRYIQGMLLDQQALLHGSIESAFLETALARMSDLIIAYRADVIAAVSGDAERGYLSSTEQLSGTLLHRARLAAPLGDLELIFTVTRLPAPPGATLINWLAAILALVLCAGFYLMYRLAARQIDVARQQQDFVAAVSHELKTPLTSIRMYGEMLREGWAPEEKKKSYYAFIHDESERLSRLIGNVLQLARMTRNDLQVNSQPVAVTELLDAVRSTVTSQVETAGFSLDMTIDPVAEQLQVNVDRDWFTQIIINLVDNAIKFSAKAGHKTIEISCHRLQDGKLQFAVRDFGPGVPRDQMKKIFQLFYRSENELTRETVGTGIGLALVHQLAQAMGGKVDVVNRQPGAEFRVVFPALAAS